jgi:hypothetical protein
VDWKGESFENQVYCLRLLGGKWDRRDVELCVALVLGDLGERELQAPNFSFNQENDGCRRTSKVFQRLGLVFLWGFEGIDAWRDAKEDTIYII